jgi:hypothetical protein
VNHEPHYISINILNVQQAIKQIVTITCYSETVCEGSLTTQFLNYQWRKQDIFQPNFKRLSKLSTLNDTFNASECWRRPCITLSNIFKLLVVWKIVRLKTFRYLSLSWWSWRSCLPDHVSKKALQLEAFVHRSLKWSQVNAGEISLSYHHMVLRPILANLCYLVV